MKTLLYIHGFMSGSNGTKSKQLSKKFKNIYNVITPELTADPDSSIEIINKYIDEYKPDIIVGTSLGGFMSLMCNNTGCNIYLCNPCLYPQKELSQWLNSKQTYFCERLDGVQTYTLTNETLQKYTNYDTISEILKNKDNIYAVCSTCDDIIGDTHYKTLSNILNNDHLIVSDEFGHQCNGKGYNYLTDLIKKIEGIE